MSSLKIPIRILIASLFLFLVATSPVAGREALLEPLPVGAKDRLGRGTVETIQYSPDGTRLAVGGSAGIWLYDTRSHDVVFLLTAPTWTNSLAFSPDGQTLATGEWNTVHLWDASTGILQHTLQGAQGYIRSLAFSPDSRTLASAGYDSTVLLWDVTTGTLRQVLQGHAAGITGLVFSPDGRTLASGSLDGTILLWDVAAEMGAPAASGDFRNLETNPDGYWVAWKRGTSVTISFSSPRASVQSHARQDPQPQFVLPEGFRPTIRLTHTVTGQRVDEDRVPVPNAPPATFDLTIGPAGEVRYVDNTKLDGLGYVDYRVVLLTFRPAKPHPRSGQGKPRLRDPSSANS